MKEGLRFSWNGAFCTFFFLNFGLNRPFWRFRPIWPIQTGSRRFRPESARFRANRPDLEPRRCKSAWVGFKKMKAMWHDAAGCGRTRGQWCPSRVAASRRVGRGCGTSGAASVLPSFFHSISCYTMGNKKEEHSSNQMVSSFSFATLTRVRATQI